VQNEREKVFPHLLRELASVLQIERQIDTHWHVVLYRPCTLPDCCHAVGLVLVIYQVISKAAISNGIGRVELQSQLREGYCRCIFLVWNEFDKMRNTPDVVSEGGLRD